MSELRKVKLKVDVDIVKQVVSKLDASIRENDKPSSYATSSIVCDYVIRYNNVEFGIKNGELIYDDMFGNKVSKFVETYIEEKLARKQVRFKKVETNKEYVFLIS